MPLVNTGGGICRPTLSVDKDKGLVIKGFLGMSKVIYFATAPKDILSLMGRTSNTTINLRISNIFSALNQNYSIDLSDIIFMYISCT